MTDAALLELRLLRAAVADLVEEQQHLHRAITKRADLRTASAMWPLLAELVGSAPFTGPSVYALALNQHTPSGDALCEMVVEYGSEDGGLKAYGKFLARLEGVPVLEHRLIKVDAVREGLVWRLQRVCGRRNPQS